MDLCDKFEMIEIFNNLRINNLKMTPHSLVNMIISENSTEV